jgi:hypothetical protein
MMAVAERRKKDVLAELARRREDVEEMKDAGLQKAIGTIIDVIKAKPAEQD